MKELFLLNLLEFGTDRPATAVMEYIPSHEVIWLYNQEGQTRLFNVVSVQPYKMLHAAYT